MVLHGAAHPERLAHAQSIDRRRRTPVKGQDNLNATGAVDAAICSYAFGREEWVAGRGTRRRHSVFLTAGCGATPAESQVTSIVRAMPEEAREEKEEDKQKRGASGNRLPSGIRKCCRRRSGDRTAPRFAASRPLLVRRTQVLLTHKTSVEDALRWNTDSTCPTRSGSRGKARRPIQRGSLQSLLDPLTLHQPPRSQLRLPSFESPYPAFSHFISAEISPTSLARSSPRHCLSLLDVENDNVRRIAGDRPRKIEIHASPSPRPPHRASCCITKPPRTFTGLESCRSRCANTSARGCFVLRVYVEAGSRKRGTEPLSPTRDTGHRLETQTALARQGDGALKSRRSRLMRRPCFLGLI
ncbi:hypothetical protein C8R47DRAFT_1190536 [Mycena vitilis]|nr:hypothetical protein C8R47DRAFT_1190536 [Mycena vitilis]